MRGRGPDGTRFGLVPQRPRHVRDGQGKTVAARAARFLSARPRPAASSGNGSRLGGIRPWVMVSSTVSLWPGWVSGTAPIWLSVTFFARLKRFRPEKQRDPLIHVCGGVCVKQCRWFGVAVSIPGVCWRGPRT